MAGKIPSQGPDKSPRLVGRKLLRNNAATPRLSKIKVQHSGMGGKPSLLEFTLLVIYKNLYILGITVIRRKRKYVKTAKGLLLRLRGGILSFFYRIGLSLKDFRHDFYKRLKAPFLRIGNVYREQKPVIASKKSRRELPVASYLQVAEAVVRLFWRIVTAITNHVAPLLAAAVLIFLVNGFINQSFGLEVVYQGSHIGYIRSEADFEAAVRDVKSRTIYGGTTYATSVPSFELVVCVDPDESSRWLMLYNDLLQRVGFKLVELEGFTPVSDIATSIIQSSGTSVEEAYGFYIDNRLYGAVKDKATLLNALELKKNLATTGKPDEEIAFDKSIALYPGLYPSYSIVPAQDLVNLINSAETVEQTYIVEENDTPTGIAEKHGLSYELLKEINPGIEDKLTVGTTIVTSSARPFLSIQTTYTDVYTEEVPFETVENPNAIYAAGYSLVTRNGSNGTREVTAEITLINGMEVSRREIDSVELVAPVSKQVTVGVTMPRSAVGSGSVSDTGFMWPVSGRVSVGMGGYPGHTGIDIAGSYGSPIMASASGTVTKTRYQYTGYGIHLVIDHGNGYQTLYAHCSDLYVRVGDYVQQGQIIAARGSTGNSTGNHLHFEVIRNNSPQNPLNYVSP